MISIVELLQFLDSCGYDYEYCGKQDVHIDGFSSLTNYRFGTITWMKKKIMVDSEEESNIGLAVVQRGVENDIANVIYSNESKAVFFGILEHFFGETAELPPVGNGTFISPNVKIGENVIIGHNCTLDGDIRIGDGTRIYNNVTIINRVDIGKNCVIQSGVSLGHDGFGYTEDEEHRKTMVKHYGGIIIGDDVYIGSNTCIERGTIDNTFIGNRTKIDICCVVGHNSIIKEDCALVTGTVLLGSVKLGRNVLVASALVRNQCTVGDNTIVGMGSVVTKDVPEDRVVAGIPAKDFNNNDSNR